MTVFDLGVVPIIVFDEESANAAGEWVQRTAEQILLAHRSLDAIEDEGVTE